jgi:glycosyltransferase involved in cell wall biosynthesis
MGVSVIICCFNSSKKLPDTLKRLAQQKAIEKVPVELVLVNNNSTDDTTTVALDTWSSLGSPFPMKVVNQPLAGLSFARDAGIKAAGHEYLVFCDDDNWLSSDYLFKVWEIFSSKPEVALIGGVGEPVFESTPPEWFDRLNGFGYALGAEGRQTGYVTSVYGAGMAVRKQALKRIMHKDFSFILSDRNGKGLSSGGDSELSLLIGMAGNKIFLDTSMLFQHYMTSDRLKWKYYLRLRRSFGKANAYLQLYHNLQGKKESQAPGAGRFVRQWFILLKIYARNFPYFLLPDLFRNERCARIFQEAERQMTCIREKANLHYASGQIINNVRGLIS